MDVRRGVRHLMYIHVCNTVNAGDQGAEQTGVRNAIFKSALQTIHLLNDHNFK
jgi:hypothetical protein